MAQATPGSTFACLCHGFAVEHRHLWLASSTGRVTKLRVFDVVRSASISSTCSCTRMRFDGVSASTRRRKHARTSWPWRRNPVHRSASNPVSIEFRKEPRLQSKGKKKTDPSGCERWERGCEIGTGSWGPHIQLWWMLHVMAMEEISVHF